jgi:hypothetical protein
MHQLSKARAHLRHKAHKGDAVRFSVEVLIHKALNIPTAKDADGNTTPGPRVVQVEWKSGKHEGSTAATTTVINEEKKESRKKRASSTGMWEGSQSNVVRFECSFHKDRKVTENASDDSTNSLQVFDEKIISLKLKDVRIFHELPNFKRAPQKAKSWKPLERLMWTYHNLLKNCSTNQRATNPFP